MSTCEYRHNATISRAAKVTAKVLDMKDASLRTTMMRLPSSKEFELWEAYLAASLPIVKARTEALAVMSVREARFAPYMNRGRELDRICKMIYGTSTRAKSQTVEEQMQEPPPRRAYHRCLWRNGSTGS